MRILMISDDYFPRVNGVSTSVQTFAREFTDKGHEVTLIAPEYGPDPGSSESGARPSSDDPHEGENCLAPDGVEIVRIPSRYLPLDPEDRIRRPSRIRRHREQLGPRGYDLVHIQTPFVAHYAELGLARRFGIPVVESYHTYFEQYLDKYVTFPPSSWLRLAARRFSAAQCGDVDALVVPSQAMLSVLEAYGVKTSAAVIPTGIDLEQFDRGDGEHCGSV